jgi:hypothetical protein
MSVPVSRVVKGSLPGRDGVNADDQETVSSERVCPRVKQTGSRFWSLVACRMSTVSVVADDATLSWLPP